MKTGMNAWSAVLQICSLPQELCQQGTSEVPSGIKLSLCQWRDHHQRMLRRNKTRVVIAPHRRPARQCHPYL